KNAKTANTPTSTTRRMYARKLPRGFKPGPTNSAPFLTRSSRNDLAAATGTAGVSREKARIQPSIFRNPFTLRPARIAAVFDVSHTHALVARRRPRVDLAASKPSNPRTGRKIARNKKGESA